MHKAAVRQVVRQQYVYGRENLTAISRNTGVDVTTITRWKRKAAADGDDWDKARLANSIAGDGARAVAARFMEDFILLVQATTDSIKKKSSGMTDQQKVDALAKLADAFGKMTASVRRTLPEINELAVALQVMQMLLKFVQAHYPKHAAAFSEVLEPFADELAKQFG